MPPASRQGALITIQDAATGDSPGLTVPSNGAAVAMIEVSGTYTNLECEFQISVDGGTRFWPITLEVLTSGMTEAPKMMTPGLYRLGDGCRFVTHFRAPITATGTPTGAMTVKVMGAGW